MHGGAIDLREDVDGVGNTFSVSLPPPVNAAAAPSG